MLTETLRDLYRRDLQALRREISAYTPESALWNISGSIKNSAGNLCLHIIGNLNHFIGATLGDTGYVRNRELEFTAAGVPASDLIRDIDDTIEMIDSVLAELPVETLSKPYPLKVFQNEMTTEYFLVHLATHLTYHLGQINYHRRAQG